MPFIRDAEGNIVYSEKPTTNNAQLPNTLGINLDRYSELEENDYIKGPYDQEYWNNERAKKQNGFVKLGNSLGQMTGTFGTSLASGVTALLSGATALGAEAITGGEAEGMDIFLNNPIMKGINDFDTYLKEDLLPTYYTEDQQNSLLSASTGTDLLNGVGFLASNILPNAAVIKAFGGLSKMAALSKAGKLERVLEAAAKVGKVTDVEKQLLSSTARYLSQAGPIVGAVVGRIGESSIEAYQTYEDLISQGVSEEEAKAQRDNVFMGNMALAVSDMAQFTRWFRSGGLGEKLVKDGLTTTVRQSTKGELLGSLLKEASQEAAEEGYQFLLSRGAQKASKGKSFIDGVAESSGELFTTIEGQKSLLLGAVLGGGMSKVADMRNAKKQKEYLQNAANNLTAQGDITERYITDPVTGKRIVNPELTKIATRFAMYEDLKNRAIEEGNQEAYDILEKTQFADLVAAKLEVGQYEDFIEQLKDMGNSTEEEIEAMFGELPTKEGIKISPQQVAQTKIKEAQRVKEMTEGLARLPKLQNQPREVMSLVRHKLFVQESLRDQIKDIDNKIAEVKSRAFHTFFPNTNKIVENELLPQDENDLKVLTEKREELLKTFTEESNEFKRYVEKPAEAKKDIDKVQETNIKEAVDNEIETIEKQEADVAEITESDETVIIDGVEYEILDENPQTGNIMLNNIATNQVTEMTKQEFLATQFDPNNLEESDTIEITPAQDRLAERIDEDPYKKDTQLSTSGQAISIQNNFHVIEDGERKLNPQFIKQTKLFNDPTISNNIVNFFNKPANIITFKATIGEVNLAETNARRKDRNLAEISEEDLKSSDYVPIKLTLQINGEDQGIDNYFHNPEYYYQTSAYDIIENNEKLSPEQKRNIHSINIQKQKEIRAKLVEQINKYGEAIIPTISKSDGMLNYNPPIDGVRKLNNVLDIFGGNSVEEFLSPKSHNLYTVYPEGNKQIKTKGLQIATDIETQEKGVKVTLTNIKGATETVSMQDAVLGQMFYEVIAPSGIVKKITPFTKNSFSSEQIDNMSELIYHRLSTGERTIQVGNKEYQIIGNEASPGIIDSLIYTGFVKSKNPEAKASQLGFDKENNLYLGKDIITKDDAEALNKISNHLRQFKSKPHFKLRSMIFNRFDIPVWNDEKLEWEMKTPKKYENFMFAGDSPLIQTALNKTMFVNSYFKFATDPEGNILTETIEEVEPMLDMRSQESQNERVKQSAIADIERRRQEEYEIAKNEAFVSRGKHFERDFKPAIDAKYDAELAALENKSTETSIPTEIQEKENECTNNKSDTNDIIGLDDWKIDEI